MPRHGGTLFTTGKVLHECSIEPEHPLLNAMPYLIAA